MEYRVNNYIDIQPLYDNKVLVLNKRSGESFELGKKESTVLSLINGKRTPSEISRICDYFSEEEIIALEKELSELDIIGKKNRPVRLNIFKVKIPLFSPNKIFKEGVLTNSLYILFITINSMFLLAGVTSTIVNLLKGIDGNKRALIQSFSTFQQWNLFDGAFILCFFVVAILLHEFGHLIVARRYKINVPDVGIMLYMFIPCAYTNLTFLNYCNSKRVKLEVFLAGSFSDFGLLGISITLFHWYSPNVVCKYFLISALICMVSITGNLVITFKFDGYYILQTLLDTSNLKKDCVYVMVSYINILFAKLKNREKKLDLRQQGDFDFNLEFFFSAIYVFLSVLYVPIMIASGIIMIMIQFGENLL